MLYAIVAEDLPGSLERRLAARGAHLERLRALQNDARLLIAEFASLEDAKAWASEDPYAAAGVYSRVDVKPFKKVFPE